LTPKIILTFDLEEFDLPIEFGFPIAEDEQFRIANEGLNRLIYILDQNKIRTTFFITGNFCEKYPDCVKTISMKHEIGSHAYYHSQFNEKDILKSKQILESTTDKQVKGFRMPLLQKINYSKLEQAGYEYDSSINPTYLPGRYNNLRVSRTPFKISGSGIIEFPVSVSPLIRFPLFWLSFKNLPSFLYRFLCNSSLKKDKFLHLYFHPWEFANIDHVKIPGYIKTPNGERYSKKFENIIRFLITKGEFVTVSEFLGNRQF
jgi:hypothetical protein